MIFSRRGFLGSLAAALATPAIVKAESLMKVAPTLILPKEPAILTLDEYSARVLAPMIDAMEKSVADAIMYGRGNSLLTIDMITQEAVKQFHNSNVFISHVNAQYNHKFSAPYVKIGSQLKVRNYQRPPFKVEKWT